jgi:hypothetical protein
MRRLRDVLRLKYEAGLAHRAIAQACTVGLGTVSVYLARALAAGLTWPLPADLDDAALEARLFARPADAARPDRTVPQWPLLHQALKRLSGGGLGRITGLQPGTPLILPIPMRLQSNESIS